MGYAESFFRELEEKQDGFFSIEEQDGIAFLTVNPPGSKGKRVELSDVLARLKLLQIEDFNKDEIEKIVLQADGKAYKIGKYREIASQNARLEVNISQDKMQAHIRLLPPIRGGKPLSLEDLQRGLKEAGVTHGIFQDVLEKLANQNEYLRWYLIAEGRHPIKGKPGYLKRLYAQTKLEPKILPDGRVDYREIDAIPTVGKDELIAEIIPPTPGQDGFDVCGKILPAENEESVFFELGPNVELTSDGRYLKSTIAGLPVFESTGRVRVDEVLYLNQVDYSTGNVNFPGTIVVEERIADGFSLSTSGSIIIKQSVGKVFIKAEGDVTLFGGFMGRGEGKIEAHGDIRARFVEQGKLVAGRSIYLSDAALHSFLVASDSVYVQGKRGEIIGGEVIAGKSVVCSKAGAIVETKTRITVGTPPEVLMALESLQNEILQKKILLNKMENTIKGLEDKKVRGKITEKELTIHQKLLPLREKFWQELNSLEKQLETALATFEPQRGSFVLVQKEIYPGVEIHFGKSRFWRSGLKPILAKISIYLNEDNQIMVGSDIPKITQKLD